jgi:hypothetical protein
LSVQGSEFGVQGSDFGVQGSDYANMRILRKSRAGKVMGYQRAGNKITPEGKKSKRHFYKGRQFL